MSDDVDRKPCTPNGPTSLVKSIEASSLLSDVNEHGALIHKHVGKRSSALSNQTERDAQQHLTHMVHPVTSETGPQNTKRHPLCRVTTYI